MDLELKNICLALKSAQQKLGLQNAAQKNGALLCVLDSIKRNSEKIFAANKIDVARAKENGMSEALVDRLSLDEKKIASILEGIKIVVEREDPIGKIVAGWKTPAALEIKQVRVPLGVVCIIYESRPNVTVDAFCLAYKSGNSILLRGSSAALNSNNALCAAIKEGLRNSPEGIPEAIELLQSTSHDDVEKILNARGLIDIVLPRGGKNLIANVVQNARIPVIETGSGVCHLFVDEDANLQMAARIAENAKIQRPGVCNSIEAILVHKNILQEFLPLLEEKFSGRVKIHADENCFSILNDSSKKARRECIVRATSEDFGNEFLDYECVVKSAESLEDAIEYINAHNTKHSECIVTKSREHARAFQQKIDAACVYVNSSTRFTDGGEFGFGAELGISTQKLHARGPMGLEALTTTKFLIDGEGQIRN